MATSKAGKPLEGRVIVPVFEQKDILASLPWVASLPHGYPHICEGYTWGSKKPCKGKARWIYVYENKEVAYLCSVHADKLGVHKEGAEVLRYYRWLKKHYQDIEQLNK